ncbi:hypothetical protein B1A87_013815 [Arthrobacter sp. KBS0703]|uniref:hypothetical protein n=1 Tax=Bacteria TaxID=2 RepID=UPI00098EC150|nr:hypothetical protein [Arthrobacter sp. KBS0703]TSE16749.1 hypothetical protein B1A87_013815 [Arthrobacter sp. KBS0703]
MTEHSSNEDDFVSPNPSEIREDLPGDAGDEANVIRFSEEQALIEEQSHGIRPQTYSVPTGGPTMDEARGNMDLSDDTGDVASGDSSDDGLHGGAEQ